MSNLTCHHSGMEKNIEPRLLRIRQAAHYAQVSETTVRTWIRDGLIPRVKISKVVRIDRADLDALVERKRTQVPMW